MLSDVQSRKTLASDILSNFLVVAGRRVNPVHISTPFPETVGFVLILKILLSRKFVFTIFSVKAFVV